MQIIPTSGAVALILLSLAVIVVREILLRKNFKKK